jgi:signal transduction histidine kinase
VVNSSRGLTLHYALLGGFGLTLGLWLFAGYLVTARFGDARRQSGALNVRYVQAQELLSSVRAQVLLTSVVIRDALLDPSPRPAADYRRDVEQAYRNIDAALAGYNPIVDPAAERLRVQRLRDVIQAFRVASLEILSTDSSHLWQLDARALLQQLLPKRESVIDVSEELQAINRTVFVGQQNEMSQVQAALQRQVLTVLGVALVISFVIAWTSYRYGVRLERRLVDQRLREEQISADLHRLSARVISVQEEERRRIARELHDEVGQALSAVNLELTGAQQYLQRTGTESDLLREARVLADGALRSVRDLSQLLHPSVLEDLGLSAAVRSFLNGFGRRTGTNVAFHDDGTLKRLTPEAELTVYRIVQEAMTNIARHASATRVEIRLAEEDGRLSVTVEDDGVGFDARDVERPGRQGGLGLLGIRERVSQLGGTVRIDSVIGRGTRLEVTIPATEHRAAGTPSADETTALELDEVHHG